MSVVHMESAPGVRLAADVYRPQSRTSAGAPAIVLALGWGSVRELMEPWGTALSSRGYVVLVPDYRGFGASDGERGRCFPEEHVEDVRSALGFATALDGVDSRRVALVGVSYGGAVTVAAGIDERAAAVISIVGYGSGARHLRALRTPTQWEDFLAMLAADEHRRAGGEPSAQLDPDAILLRDEEARTWRREVEARLPHMAFTTTVESAQRMVEFEPERNLPYAVRRPVMMIHAGEDRMIPVDESIRMWSRAADPRELVVVAGLAHHDVHVGVGFEQVIDHVHRFLELHMGLS